MLRLLLVAFFAVVLFDDTSARTAGVRRRRMMNAVDVDIVKVPWHVGLLKRPKNRLRFTGSGSIISSKWVLTAAHCVCDRSEPESIPRFVSTGASGLWNGAIYSIDRTVCHPSYSFMADSDTTVNDIALLRAADEFSFDSTRKSISLYAGEEGSLGGSVGAVSGWGSGQPSGEGLSRSLKVIEMTISPRSECDHFLSLVYNSTDISPGRICANGLAESYVCYGDSGGSLVVDATLVGVASWIYGDRCGNSAYPAVFTAVSSYRDWIGNVTHGRS